MDSSDGDSGDTLIETLLALVIIGIAGLSILVALVSSISASANYRDVASVDSVLRSAASEVTSQIEQQPTTLWANCTAVNQVVFSLPTGYSATISSAQYWNGTTYVATCVANSSMLVTIDVSYNGHDYTISTVIYNPHARPVPLAGAATKLAFIGQPGNGVIGSPLSPGPVVAIEDANGTVVSTDLSPVAISLTAGTGTAGASLSSGCSSVVFYGVVTFSNCSVNMAGSNFTLTATDGTLAPATSGAFNVAALAASQLVVTSPTSSGVASSSANLGPITIQEQDIYGNPVNATSPVTVSLSSTSIGSSSFATTLGGASLTSVVIPFGSSQVSFFYGDTRVGTPTITASSSGLTSGAQSESVLAAPAAGTVITTNPFSVTASSSATASFSISLVDAFGNPTTKSTSTTITLSTSSLGGKFATTSGGFSVTTVTLNANAASANAYYGDTKAGSPTITAAAAGLASGFQVETITAGPGNKFIFTTGAFTATAGGAPNQPFTLALEDVNGNPTTSASAITVNLSSTSAGGRFAATPLGANVTSVVLAAGTSTITAYYGDTNVGAPTIVVTATGYTGTSQNESVKAFKLAITSSPFSIIAGTSATQQFTIQVQNGAGSAVSLASSTTITMTSTSAGAKFAVSSAGAASSTVLLPANTSSIAAYYADTTAGSPTISVAATGGNGASQTDTVTAGSATQVSITSSPFTINATNNPTQVVTVSLKDAFGNLTTSPSAVTVNVGSTSSGALFSDTSGGATTSSVTLPAASSSVNFYYADTRAGTPSITVAASGLSGGAQVETVNTGVGISLVITSAPAGTQTAGTAFAMTVSVEDAFGNVVTTQTGSNDSLSLTLSSGNFAAGSTTLSAVNGVATFSGLKITAVGTYVITASDLTTVGVTPASTGPINVKSAVASKLVITSVPFVTGVGTSATQAVTVTLEDTYGNLATSAGTITVNLTSTSNGAKFAVTSGGTTATSVTLPANTSVVSFFYADTKAGSPTITASASGLSSASQSETVTPGVGTKLAITSSPFSQTIGGGKQYQVTVTLEDVFGNATTNANSITVNLSSTSALGTFSATSGGVAVTNVTLAAGSPTANFYYSDTKAGTPTISVSSSGLTGDSQTETILPGAPSKFVITSVPFTSGVGTSATQVVTVTLEDAYGNPTSSASAITVNLSSTSSGATFAATSAGASVTSVTLVANTSTVNFYYADTRAGSPTITTAGSGLTSGSQSETLTPGVGTKLVITSAPFTIARGSAAAQAVVVTLQDAYGNATTKASAITVNLSSTSSGAVFATSPSGSSVTSVVLPAGSSSVTFYYGDTRRGSPTITTSATGLTNGTQTETVTP